LATLKERQYVIVSSEFSSALPAGLDVIVMVVPGNQRQGRLSFALRNKNGDNEPILDATITRLAVSKANWSLSMASGNRFCRENSKRA